VSKFVEIEGEYTSGPNPVTGSLHVNAEQVTKVIWDSKDYNLEITTSSGETIVLNGMAARRAYTGLVGS
jgi:hypothetical protein